MGEDAKVQAYTEMCLEEVMDMRNALMYCVYNPDYVSLLATICTYWEQVSKISLFESFRTLTQNDT